MTWTINRVLLRLRSPMHIGWNKVGNVQRTRSYVTGRVLWGALTERVTRDEAKDKGPATDSRLYAEVGKTINGQLAFSYFYPTTDPDGEVRLWPWHDDFRRLHLSTYASTALAYPEQSADEGTLHEVECLVPQTMNGGDQVYLSGYVLALDDAPPWESALWRLQLGGERGYGWGRVEPVTEPSAGRDLFGYKLDLNADRPIVHIPENGVLLAHTLAAGLEPAGVSGRIEPLVGRVTNREGHFGGRLTSAQICLTPGTRTLRPITLQIGAYGIWEAVS